MDFWNGLDNTQKVGIIAACITSAGVIIAAIINKFGKEKKAKSGTIIKQTIKGDAENVTITGIYNNYGEISEKHDSKAKEKK